MKGQMELETEFDLEKSIKENIRTTEKFVYTEIIRQTKMAIMNEHEGYGILAENFSMLMGEMKSTKKIMDDILKGLPLGSEAMIKDAGRLYDAAIGCAMEAIELAAQAERAINDLYEETPLEQYEKTMSNQQISEDEDIKLEVGQEEGQ